MRGDGALRPQSALPLSHLHHEAMLRGGEIHKVAAPAEKESFLSRKEDSLGVMVCVEHLVGLAIQRDDDEFLLVELKGLRALPDMLGDGLTTTPLKTRRQYNASKRTDDVLEDDESSRHDGDEEGIRGTRVFLPTHSIEMPAEVDLTLTQFDESSISLLLLPLTHRFSAS